MDTVELYSLQTLLVRLWVFLVLFSLAVLWRVFTKAGQSGWRALIPVHNIYILTRLAGKSGWWALLILLPPITLVALPIVLLDLGKSFGKPPQYGLFAPLLADGNATYMGSYPGDGAIAPSPQRGAFLTSVLLYQFVGFTGATIASAFTQTPMVAVLFLAMLILTYTIWRLKQWAVFALLAVWVVTAALNYFVLYPGPRVMSVVLIGLAGDLIFMLLLVAAFPIGRRVAGVSAAPQLAA